eukprot:scaffold259099_cov35-Prasinocladus_malaysianus.AAC.6
MAPRQKVSMKAAADTVVFAQRLLKQCPPSQPRRERVSFKVIAEGVRFTQKLLAALNPTYEYGTAKRHVQRPVFAVSSAGTPTTASEKLTSDTTAPVNVQDKKSLKTVVTAVMGMQRMSKLAAGNVSAKQQSTAYHHHGHKADLLARELPPLKTAQVC